MEIKYLFLLFICVSHPVSNLSIMPLFPEEPYVEASICWKLLKGLGKFYQVFLCAPRSD